MNSDSEILIASQTGTGTSEGFVVDGPAHTVEVLPASSEGTWTGVINIEHFAHNDWTQLYQDGSAVVLDATQTVRRIEGPLMIRAVKEATNVAVQTSIRQGYGA